MTRSIHTTKTYEDAYFDKKTLEKLSKLSGNPLVSHITIERTKDKPNHDKIENIYFNDQEGLLSKFFNKTRESK
ncbi:MAG: hypothetical protein LBE20_07725 [Deltaproteobacteria bacterium]|jgi:hypothetical protein|nr:hypothetical protein [Deltaproteobacteria bacterium]